VPWRALLAGLKRLREDLTDAAAKWRRELNELVDD
jgi:hypothetical protein